MQVVPYLNFDGTCAEAFRFYEQVLGGNIEMMMTHGESPMAGELPAEWHDRVMHARLTFGGQTLMASDLPPGERQTPQGMAISLHLDSAADADRIFGALADGGNVTMPIEKTFWAERFGMVTDRFGTPWMLNYEGNP